jgi:hypothetical protein
MTPSRVNWPALIATIGACCIVDGGLFFFGWSVVGDFLGGVFIFLMAGGPITLFMLAPTYAWFKAAFGRRSVA